MTTTDTRDVEKTVDQVKLCADRGADLVRITVQGRREAEACGRIRDRLFQDGYDTPLVADIHFQPKIAMMVAEAFEKIRVNPGNFVDGRKSFDLKNYDEGSGLFDSERQRIADTLGPLVERLRTLGRALRIGTNHGSLSARVLGYYGDTPRGMVESAFEFADICRGMDYHNFLFSMKASNPTVMVSAYRLLSEEMAAKGWDYPIHLGVTEAGEGEDGRMKSAIGIGALLLDGIGDTIRVSLTEDPELEIQPCATLARLGERAQRESWGARPLDLAGVPGASAAAAAAPSPLTSSPALADLADSSLDEHRDTHVFSRRETSLPLQRPTDEIDYRSLLHRDGTLWLAVDGERELADPERLYRGLGARTAVGMPIKDVGTADALLLRRGTVPGPRDAAARKSIRRLQEAGVQVVAHLDCLRASPVRGAVALVPLGAWHEARRAGRPLELPEGTSRFALLADGSEPSEAFADADASDADALALVPSPGASAMHLGRRVYERLRSQGARIPLLLGFSNEAVAPSPGPSGTRDAAAPSTAAPVPGPAPASRDDLIIPLGATVGSLLVDGVGEGVLLDVPPEDLDFVRSTGFGLLQGVRMRSTKTDYVSCPSCGRTLFDLQEVTDQIKTATGHLPGVSIAVMGCIVNGPGEMADADFGYVGGAPGLIDLYVGKQVVHRGIPMEEACGKLIQLIKDHDRWVDKPKEEAKEPVEA